MNDSLGKQQNNDDPHERQGLLGGLAQRLQESVRATLDALRQGHAQQLAAIVEFSDDAVISTDLNGTIATWNKGAAKVYGYDAEEAVGQSITIVIPPEFHDEDAVILARIRRGERVEHYETVRQRKDGRRVPISLTVSPIMNADGQVVGASKVGRDISLRRDAEEARAALYNFTDRLFRAESTEDIYQAALDAIIRALGCDRASVLLFDGSGVMRFVAWRGLSSDYRRAVEGHSPWTRDSRNPQPISIGCIETAELDAALKATVRNEGIAALAFIPLAVKGELAGKFMTYYPVPHDFTETDISVAVTIARQLGFSIERMRAEQARRTAEEGKNLLLKESKHRIKNTLATVQGIATQTLRQVNRDALQAFLARLHALDEAHELLTTENWHQAPLKEVVDHALQPFAAQQDQRVVADGPSVWMPANTSLNLTLCLHELATNAVKYGALSNGSGEVRVSWQVAGDAEKRTLRLTWQEAGGPPVKPPERSGFGSLLIQTTGEAGTWIDFRPEGVRCLLNLSL